MKPAHSFEASGTMKETRDRARCRGDERWICVFVGQCVTAAAAEEEEEKEKATLKNSNERSFMLHVSVLQHHWSPCYKCVAVHLHMLVQRDIPEHCSLALLLLPD